MSNNNYTLSLNPNITTQTKKQEIQLENKELITQPNPQTTQIQEAEGKEAEAKINAQTQEASTNQTAENGLPRLAKARLAMTEEQATQATTPNAQQASTATNQTTQQQEANINQNTDTQQAQTNDLTQNAEYQEFIRQKLAQEQKVKEAYLDYTNAFKGSKKSDEGFSIHDYTGRNALNNYVKQRNKDKENQAAIYDYLAKYGEHNAETLGIKIDKDELNKARARLSIKHKDIKDLTEYEKKVLSQNESIGSRAIDFFRDEKKVLQERKNKLTTNEIDSNALIEIGKLHNITTSLLDFTKNDKEAKEQKRQFLKEASNIAKKYGYDTIAYDNKAKDYVLIKDGKKYYTDLEGFFNNFDKVINNNYYDIVVTTGATLAAPFTGGTSLGTLVGMKGAQVATTQAIKTASSTLGKEALKAGALSAALSPIDYVANSNDLNRDINLKEMANYSIGNAAGAVAGTLAIGGAIKGVSKSIDLAKGLKDLNINDLKNIKVKNILDNEEMAISRKLAKFDKNELNANYENFKRIQSDTIISKDIRQGGMLESFIDKVNQYNPLERFTSKKETQERLLSSIFSNKELSREFAGQLTSEEAQIINKAVTKMGDNFKNLSKEYEQEIIKEYVKSGKTNIDSIPALYKELLSEIDKEAKLNYSKSIKNLHENLNEVDFKDTLLQGYKNITDGAIDSLGIENELTRTLIRETQKLESKPSIALNEAIELRKDINEILRNYEKNSSDLKKYRAEQHLQALKENIDNSIKNALDSKVANTELKQAQSEALFTEYLNANKQYAQIKEAMKDKFSKAITKGMDKKTLNSSLTTEQWKKRVLDTDWGDSVRGLENTIFKNFNPKMQENTQMLLIFRALERNIHEVSDSTPINFNKILQDIEKLESMQLAPKVYPVLDLFKSYSKAYQFSQDIARAKGLEMMHGGGAMATTLEGRMQVFLTNRLFKKVFAHIPYLGDNNAILKSLSKAIKNLKYPSEITLETLKQLRENDLQRGFKPNAKNNNIALKDIAETTPKTDKELQTAIKGSKDRILTQQAENELESLATNPHLLELENLDKYKTQIKERQDYFFTNFDKTRDELAKGEFVAKDYIKEDTELINEISQRLARDAQFTPDLVALHLTRGENNYTFMQDKHGINYIFQVEKTKPTPPKTYDEIKALENAENAELQSYKEQVSKFIEKRQAQQSLRGEAEAIHLQEKEIKELDLNTALKELDNIKGEAIPPNIDIETFLKKYNNIENKENFIKHLQTRDDAESRLTYINLVEPTLTRYDFVLDTINKKGEPTKEFIKVFNKDEKNKYYLVITPRDNENFLLTGIYLNREQKLINKMQKAKSIKARNPKEVSPLQSPITNHNGMSLTLQENNNIKTPTSKDLLLKITEKNHDLQKIKQRLELQTTPKGKKHYQRELELKEKELQELEIQAGIRSEINVNNNRAKTKDIQDTEYTLTTKDNEKIILTENEINHMQKTLGLHYINELKHIENNIAPMLDSKLILDMPKYIKSVDKIKARESEKLKKGMFDYNIAIKDTDNNIYLLTKNEHNDKFYTLKATKENGDYYIKGDNDLTLNQIQDKIKSGSEVLESNLKEIESHTKHYKKGEAIPFTKIRETSIQTEKMKEAIKADYVVIKKAHLKPNFESESGLQYRNIKQDEVIKDIANNLNVNKLVNHEGSFQGLPLIQHDGQIISGNHRGQGLLNLNEASRKAYEKAIKERFNIDLKSDEILVRKINENVSNEKILQLAKASNEGLENTLQEAIYTKLSKYEPHIKDLKDLHETSLENIKHEVNARLKGSPTDIQETNLALLSAQVKDTKDFIQSLNTMQKKNGFEKTFNMLVDNAGNFYQLGKDYKELNISELLNEGVRVLANTQSNTNDTFKKLAQDFTYYLKSSNRKAIQEQRESMGLNKDPFIDFKAQVLGATLKRYTINNINPSEQLHNKIQSFKQIAQEAQGPQLFGEPIKINDTLFINHLYADIADTRTDIGFLLRVADTMQDLESKKITTNEIQDKNIKEFVENLPRQ